MKVTLAEFLIPFSTDHKDEITFKIVLNGKTFTYRDYCYIEENILDMNVKNYEILKNCIKIYL